jgi:sugar phosphate isomerase/epimerase
MRQISRRTFVKTASASLALVAAGKFPTPLMADPLGLPLGLQLYSVRNLLPKDYEGTLKQLGAIGYREVEAAGFFDHSVAQVKQAMQQAGLSCVSSHYPMSKLLPQLDSLIEFNRDVGVKWLVCAAPMPKNASDFKPGDPRGSREAMTLDDWRWCADQFNQMGERIGKAGLRFAYHNHVTEFRSFDGTIVYDEVLKLTDPAKVSFELDCGWCVIAGKNPADYLSRYPTRFAMLHVKDFKLTGPVNPSAPPPSTELGHGTIDYHPIFKAAKKCPLEHAFIEQEEFDMDPMAALKIDAAFMQGFTV